MTPRGCVPARRDLAGVPHRGQHLVAPALRRRPMARRIEPRRRLRQAGDHRRLHERQPPGRAREVCPRRGLDAVGVAPVERPVHVRHQDLALRHLAAELDRQARLRELARDVELGITQVAVAHELLLDRRPALDGAPRAHVGDRGASDRLVVDRAVALPEPPVLDRDGGLGQPLAHAPEADRLAVPGRRDGAERARVARVHERLLPPRPRPLGVEVAAHEPARVLQEQRNGGDACACRQQHEQQEDARDP